MQTHTKLDKELFDIETFMGIYSLKRSRVYTEIREGRLKITKLGARTYIAKKDAEDWLDIVRELTN